LLTLVAFRAAKVGSKERLATQPALEISEAFFARAATALK
jgi:hypothetical protein